MLPGTCQDGLCEGKVANIPATATEAVINVLTAQAGQDFALNAIVTGLGQVSAIPRVSILPGNTPADMFEKSLALKYPTVNVFCEKLANTLKEKYRVFSGTVHMVVEIRHSEDQIQNIQDSLQIYTTAVCQLLDTSRGDFGGGVFYAGGYEVAFNPLKRGGRNFLQTARVGFDLDVSL